MEEVQDPVVCARLQQEVTLLESQLADKAISQTAKYGFKRRLQIAKAKLKKEQGKPPARGELGFKY